MNEKEILVVLTENTWLYAGLTAMLPEMRCLRMNFNTSNLPCEIQDATRIIIAVDCRVFFSGEWTAFNHLRVKKPGSEVVWMVREETGPSFPAGKYGEYVLGQKQDIVSLGKTLRNRYLNCRDNVSPASLSSVERFLLPYFMSGMSMPKISGLTGKAVKVLYRHRRSIMLKTGFRNAAFMQFVYSQNQGLPWLILS